MSMRSPRSTIAIALLTCVFIACNADGGSGDRLPREDLLKPETCKGCHPRHYEQWSASMHAYASKDPVFRAMNARGQREKRDLGEFCVNCHAPMAVREGATKDGTDLNEVPEYLQGVTCYFCHNVTKVRDDHNNVLQLADDRTMRAGVSEPVDPKVHEAEYSELHDGNQLESSAMCGGCHDIVTPSGVHLERTFEEYEKSFASQPANPDLPGATPSTCASCHMRGQPGTVIADVKGAGVRGDRTFHEHLFPAVDVALSKFPHREALKSAVEDCELPQSIGLFEFGLDVDKGPNAFVVTLETLAGHNQPSGASQDRRMWLEIAAYDQHGMKIFETDEFKDDAAESDGGINPPKIFHDSIYGEDERPVNMFWQAATSEKYPDGYVSRSLPYGPRSTTPMAPSHSLFAPFRLLPGQVPERFEINLRMRPMGFDVLQDLVDSGDLDADVLKEIPTFTVYSSTIEHMKDGGPDDFMDPTTPVPNCDRYQCMIEPDLPQCAKD
jgi:hypothetical protein